MKMRRIPDTELARICVLPQSEQLIPLKRLKAFHPPHTLNPFRMVVPDIVNLQYELLGKNGNTTWQQIEHSICSSKETEDGVKRNLAVARALFDYCKSAEMVSYYKPVSSWSVGYGNSVSYWNPFYSVWEGQAAFLHFDPRLANPLTLGARKFAFSMMHQRLRVNDPDFSDVKLNIVCFGRGDDGARTVKLHSASETSLYTYDELTDMINVTYRLWVEELEQRREVYRKSAGGHNPMGF